MRDPSIHIKLSDLKKVLGEIMPMVNIPELATLILKKARPYSPTTRMVSVSSDKMIKKVDKLLKSDTRDADTLARIIYAVRIKLKHKGVSQIKPTSRDWGLVKEIAGLADNFCLDFDLDRRAGYIEYITIASSKMKAFGLHKIPNMHESIANTYQATKEIAEDDDPEFTLKVHDYYRVKVAKSTGMINKFTDDPERYVYFVRTAQSIKELGANPYYYLDSQFDGMEYRNSYPEPMQLIGQKAKVRFNKWLYKKGLKV